MRKFYFILTVLLSISSWLTAQTTETYLHFDGQDDKLSLSSPLPPTGSDARTVEFMVKPDAGAFGNQTIVSWGSAMSNGELFEVVLMSAGPPTSVNIGLNFGPMGPPENMFMAMNSSIPVGSWSHVAISYDGTTVKIYINGVLKDSATPTLNTSGTGFQWIIGANANSQSFLKGGLDEFRIWNVARTESEIDADKGRQLCGSESGLVSYYDLNDGTPSGSNTSLFFVTDKGSNKSDGMFNNTFALNGSSSNFLDGSPITPSANPPKVSAPSIVYAKDATASALTAQGQGLKWYTTATGGTGSTTAPTPSTATVGKTAYWVSQTLCGTESGRTKITVYTIAAATANSLHFDGVNDYVSGYNSALPLTTTTFTGTFEFRLKTMKTDCDIFAYGNIGTPNAVFGIGIRNGFVYA